ncbi:MAG TPA: GNAT family N-acetyltransferase, partial [Gammaproteobacteria bacterium]|nr:GNAT family N-acetyltransferase [Gammaproteobacteria bacterium]
NFKPNPASSDRKSTAFNNHRRLLVFSGSKDWAQKKSTALITDAALPDKQVLWLGNADASRILGSEFSLIVFDAYTGFDADTFGMASGTLIGGGTFILLCPPLNDWPSYDDPANEKLIPFASEPLTHSRFLQRAVKILQQDSATQIIEQTPSFRPPPSSFRRKPESILPATKMDSGSAHAPCRADMTAISGGLSRRNDKRKTIPATPDQSNAIKAIIHAGKSRARRPVVLTADRGRGKSTALGLAAAELLNENLGDIVITAPRPSACEQAFIHAAKTLRYVAPDVLAHDETLQNNPPRLVMVDEAAAIPTPLLTRILQRFPRTVFSTTVHGYEGTGRGFALRFRKTLDTLTPDWKAVTLQTPIRWAENDPLENVTAKLLLLDAEAASDDEVMEAATNNCEYTQLDRDTLIVPPFATGTVAPTKAGAINKITPVIPAQAGIHLLDDEKQKCASSSILNELFGLLVLAHYRTRPFDLRLLLDAPNIRIYCTFHNKRVAAVALVALEGGLGTEIAQAIRYGQRRPQGHLLPETLAAQAGFADAATLKAARVLRIAVHPAVQGRGLGGALLKHINNDLSHDVDYIGSVFGATPGLLKFWQQAGFTPAWLGTTRGKSTGEHAALLMQPLSPAGQELQTAVKKHFADNLPQQLADPQSLADLEPALVCELLQSNAAPAAPSANDWSAIETFAHGTRPFESVLTPVWRFAQWLLSESARCNDLSEQQITALVTRVIQRQTWQQVVRACDVAGKPQVIALLREACAEIVPGK